MPNTSDEYKRQSPKCGTQKSDFEPEDAPATDVPLMEPALV